MIHKNAMNKPGGWRECTSACQIQKIQQMHYRIFCVAKKSTHIRDSNLDQSTLISLILSLKFNCDSCCCNTDFNSELLTDCEKATLKSLQPISSSASLDIQINVIHDHFTTFIKLGVWFLPVCYISELATTST